MTLFTRARRAVKNFRKRSWTPSTKGPDHQSLKELPLTDAVITDGLIINIGGKMPYSSEGRLSKLWLHSEKSNPIEFELLERDLSSPRFQAVATLPRVVGDEGEQFWRISAVVGDRSVKAVMDSAKANAGRSSVSQLDGARWRVVGDDRGFGVAAEPPTPRLSVHRVAGHIGSIVFTMSGHGSQDGSYVLVVRKRKTPTEFRVSFVVREGQGTARLRGPDLLSAHGADLSSRTVWDVFVIEESGRRYRPKCGIADITHPRAVFRYSGVSVYALGVRRTVRPYWTLDGHLSIEVKGGITSLTPTGGDSLNLNESTDK